MTIVFGDGCSVELVQLLLQLQGPGLLLVGQVHSGSVRRGVVEKETHVFLKECHVVKKDLSTSPRGAMIFARLLPRLQERG